jgi:beta-glucosidase
MLGSRADDLQDEFRWGVSTAAYQIEGAHLKYGKGPSIWDEFTKRKGKIFDNQNGDIACDFYHNYPQDLALMRALNIRHFRFSISWSRIFPHGTGSSNKAGVDFYNRVIDFCLELEIEPWITLYHWDLPLELEKKGGWTNRDIIGWFNDYAAFCVRQFGDRVRHWMVLNEPMAFVGAGYFLGMHAPGKKDFSSFLLSVHHATLCQAEGGRTIKSMSSHAIVGTTFSFSQIQPATTSDEDMRAAIKVDALMNRVFMEPLLGLGYPAKELKLLARMEEFMKDGDDGRMQFNMDFLGVQNYTREIVAHSYLTPLIHANIIKASERKVKRTAMNWEVYPESIYEVLKRVSSYHGCPTLIVTENGAAFEDQVIDGHINDVDRTEYLQAHIAQVLKARSEGVNVQGYFVWTFMDNFEWAEGYRPRFGLVHVDFATQKRTVKSSGLWYSRFIAANDWSEVRGERSVVSVRS